MKNSRDLDARRLFNPQDTENTVIYAWVLEFPKFNTVELPSVKITEKTTVQLLGTTSQLRVKQGPEGIIVDLSSVHWTDFPSKDALILKIQYAENSDYDPLQELKRIREENAEMGLKKWTENKFGKIN